MKQYAKPIIHGPGSGEHNDGFGFNRWFRITPKDTDGKFAVFEEEIPEGAGPPIHVHKTEFELFIVLDGRMKFHCDGVEEVAEPGTTVLIPPGARHAFRGMGPGTSRVLIMLAPGRGEGLFRDLASAELLPPTDMDAINEIAACYDVEFVGPPLD